MLFFCQQTYNKAKYNHMKKIHKFSAIFALLLILTFFISTLMVEIFGSYGDIRLVKEYIFYALSLLIPAIITAGASGNFLAKNRKNAKIVQNKMRRMKIIAFNGIFFLVPSAVFLWYLSNQNQFGAEFVSVQVLEFVAGATNIYLMVKNARDGLRLKGK